jgi:PAS domain S-box-containing protein
MYDDARGATDVQSRAILFSMTDDSRARLAAIVDSSDDAILSMTVEGMVTSWNRAAEQMFGWRAAEALGRHITFIVPDDRHAEAANVLARIRQGETVDHVDTVRMARDGRPLMVSVTTAPIKDDAGRIIGAATIARDISSRQQSEIDRSRLAAIVASSDDAIISKDLTGVITSWNPGAERIFGWTAAEAVGRHIRLIIPKERFPEQAEVLARIRRGDRVDHFETLRVTKDGRLLTISLTVSPIRDSGGRIIGASKIGRDITERRRLDEEREQLLAREQRARAEAEALNRTKDEFLATMSHELRTPLNAIFGWARMLQSSDLDEATHARAVDVIVRSASAQSRLVEDLLDLSRIVSGRMRLELERFEMRTVIDAALDTVRPAAAAKSITLQTQFDPRVTTMTGAPARLQQVIWNLLMNAVKFTPAGGRVEVSLRPSGSGHGIDVVVADSGEGIGSEILPYIFDRFRQEDSSTTRRYGGLGLGLALVRHLVELHGGTVQAESPGKGLGATFTVRLPMTPPERTHFEPGAGAGTLADARPRLLRGIRVLVVDDNAEALELTATMLRSDGADVRMAAATIHAYEIADAWRPDILVSDLAMPEEDGFALLQGLRTAIAKHGARLPAIALSAYGTMENQLRATDAGFDLYLMKPVDPHKFTEAVASLARRVS